MANLIKSPAFKAPVWLAVKPSRAIEASPDTCAPTTCISVSDLPAPKLSSGATIVKSSKEPFVFVEMQISLETFLVVMVALQL